MNISGEYNVQREDTRRLIFIEGGRKILADPDSESSSYDELGGADYKRSLRSDYNQKHNQRKHNQTLRISGFNFAADFGFCCLAENAGRQLNRCDLRGESALTLPGYLSTAERVPHAVRSQKRR